MPPKIDVRNVIQFLTHSYESASIEADQLYLFMLIYPCNSSNPESDFDIKNAGLQIPDVFRATERKTWGRKYREDIPSEAGQGFSSL